VVREISRQHREEKISGCKLDEINTYIPVTKNVKLPSPHASDSWNHTINFNFAILMVIIHTIYAVIFKIFHSEKLCTCCNICQPPNPPPPLHHFHSIKSVSNWKNCNISLLSMKTLLPFLLDKICFAQCANHMHVVASR
jgi:hypothetical protein